MGICHQMTIGSVFKSKGLYLIPHSSCIANMSKHQNFTLWHYILGHPSNQTLKQLIPDVKEELDTSEACIKAKMSSLPF